MPFQIIRNDITKVKADVIVNSANPRPKIGPGVDSAIYEAAGKEQLIAKRKQIGRLRPGQAALTPAFLLNAKYIIHTIGPVWNGGLFGEADTLKACYNNCLSLADSLKAESIAFPLISTGNYRFPKDLALNIAMEAIGSFLLTHEMNVFLVVFDQKAFVLSQRLMGEIDVFIDEYTVSEMEAQRAAEEDRGFFLQHLFPYVEDESDFSPVLEDKGASPPSSQAPSQKASSWLGSLVKKRRGASGQDTDKACYGAAPLPEELSKEKPEPSHRYETFGAPDQAGPEKEGELSLELGMEFHPESSSLESAPFKEPDFVRGCEAGETTKSASEPSRQVETGLLEEKAKASSPKKAQEEAVLFQSLSQSSSQSPLSAQFTVSSIPEADTSVFYSDKSLEELVSFQSETFQEKLFKLIDQSGMNDVTVYKKANIDRKLFSRIRCNKNYHPSKKTALAFAIALELDLPSLLDLLGRAELTLSPCSKFDLIISYFVTHKNYNIYEINAALFKYDLPTLDEKS